MMLPDAIARHLAGKAGTADTVGLSGSSVTLFDDCVLKITEDTPDSRENQQVLSWLEGKIPVPKVIVCEFSQGKRWLLTEKVQGLMSCDKEYLRNPQVLISALAYSLQRLHSVDTTGCPEILTQETLLNRARYRVENGLVEMDLTEPETFGPDGFASPWELLTWLEKNRPESRLCLIHGDFCLPNIFLENGQLSAFIDLDDCGVGEAWRDIALCWRSLKHNADGTYGAPLYPDIDPDALFPALGIEPDWQQIRWHLLMDELF